MLNVHHVALDRNVKQGIVMLSLHVLELCVEQVFNMV